MPSEFFDNLVENLEETVSKWSKTKQPAELAHVLNALYMCTINMPNAEKYSAVSMKLKQAETAYYVATEQK